ncbi:MAG: sugar ABC transporter permease YjfF [Planctomycetota bacterium]|nr:sugar ABC transporter permease YjfF [Planctomycetota bacterium]
MKLHQWVSRTPVLATWLLLLGLFAFGAASYPNFASVAVIRNLLVDNAFLAVAAIGMTFVIISGGIDLSVGSVMAFSATLAAALIESAHLHPLVAAAVVLLTGLAFGLVQGLLIALLEVPPFMVTLAGMFLARGAAFAVHPQSRGITHPFVSATLNESLALHLPLGPRGIVIPPTVIAMLVLVLLAWILLRHARFGRAVHAIGDDPAAAKLMGLPVARVKVQVYALCGCCSALAGLFFALYQQSGDPASCKGLELDVIAAVIIGGTLLKGGVGSVVGSLAGVMILGLIQTIISFQGDLSSWWTRIVAGGLVLVFLLLHGGVGVVGRRVGG